MRIKAPIFKSVLAGLALSSALVVPAAFAQRGQNFNASSSWDVTNVSADMAYGPAYCVLSRSFDGQVGLSFAQNASREASIAINFSKADDSFAAVKRLVLDPGAGQQRAMDADLLDGSAFLVKVGQDPTFFNALSKTGFLRVEIAGQSYNFDLSDFDQARSQLRACLSSLDLSPVPPPRVEQDSVVMAANALAESARAQSDEPTGAPVSLLATKTVIDETAKTVKQTAVLDKEMLALQQRYDDLRSENEDLRVELATMITDFGRKDTEFDQLQAEISQLRTDNNAMQRKYSDARAQEKAGLEALIAERDKTIETLSARAESLTTELANVSDAVSSPAQPATPAPLAVEPSAELSDTITALRAENETLKAANLDYAAMKDDYATKLNALKADLALAEAAQTNQVSGRAETIAQLTEQVEQLKSENVTLKSENTRHAKILAEKEASIQDAQAQIASAQSSDTSQQAELSAQLEVLQSENEVLKAANTNYANQQKALEMQLSELENTVAEQSATSAVQVASLSEMSAKLDGLAAENDKLKAENIKYLAFRDDNASLREKLSAAETVAVAAASQAGSVDVIAQLDALKTENAALKTENAALQDLQAAHDTLKSQLADLQAGNSNLSAQVAALEAERTSLQQRIADAQHANVEASDVAEMDVLKREYDAMRAENQQLSSQLALAKKAGDVLLQKYNQEQEARIALQNGGTSQPQALAAVQAASGADARDLAASDIDVAVPAAKMVQADVPSASPVVEDASAQNEAQRLEKNILSQVGRQPATTMSVRASEDPYAPIETAELAEANKDDQGWGFVPHDRKDEIAGNAMPDEAEPDVAVANRAIQAERLEQVAVNEAAAQDAALQDAAMRTPAPAAPAAPRVADLPLPSADYLKGLLYRSGVTLSSPVSVVADVSTPVMQAYQWNVGDLYGSAEQRALVDAYQFDDKVKEYLMRTEARCAGEFAVIPVSSNDFGTMRVDSYDIACLSDNLDATASLVFFNQDGVFSVVAHEAPADMLETAMDLRDRLARSLQVKSGA